MKHNDRRKELGKMFLDIAKYLATVGLIGGILTNSLNSHNWFNINRDGFYLSNCSFLYYSTQKRRLKMESVYIIFIGLLLLALWGFIISYREDHPKKPSSESKQ
ncbi:MAG: hypothetical protein ACE5IR_23400 [bacterium]